VATCGGNNFRVIESEPRKLGNWKPLGSGCVIAGMVFSAGWDFTPEGKADNASPRITVDPREGSHRSQFATFDGRLFP